METGKINLFDQLKTYKSFSKLVDSELIWIINLSMVRSIRKGMILFYQGDKTDGVYFILSGRVNVIKYRSDESSLILNKLENGKWLALAENIADGPYLTDALVEEKSELLYIQKNNFKKLLELSGFCKIILSTISLDYYSLHANLETNSPLQKILRYFKAYIRTYKDYNDNSGSMTIEITQEDLAASIGFTRETVNKHLSELQKKNIISLSRGKIEVMDIANLEKLD
jgi:CRP/FNR family transcriptional regulator, cyclic AMP receptor protein